jgi:hypothetical protein
VAAGDFGLTHVSALSIGWDPARADYTPRERSQYYLSIGTLGTSITQLISSTLSVDVGGVTASRTTTVDLYLANVRQNDLVQATPWSQWSGTLVALSYHAYCPSDHSVTIAFSNNSGNNITVPTINWRVACEN